MAILVTGGSGYIGSVTVECLLAKGEAVVVLDDLAHGHRAALPANIPFYQGKIADRDLVARIAREHAVESCIHFAAMIEVGESVKDPAKYFENNVAQGIAFAEELLQAGVKRLVFSSTAAIYGDPEEIPIKELSRKWPKNPYGWSKLFMEQLFSAYDHAYGLKFVALRYFNAAGATERCGEDHKPESHLIPNVLAAALGQQRIIRVYGDNYPTPDGTPIRDYIHVVDLAYAHIRALDYLRAGWNSDFFNLGTGNGYSVLEVIECARQVTGHDIPMQIEPPRQGDPVRLIADPSKAKSVLGWDPSVSDLKSIIQSAWKWRVQNPGGYAIKQTDD
ncbi:MAG TPA: UDP-glucose 4-epimerase GalE [Candidatus Saccharimonadales bacterium]|jgi:UDP-glucose 4-epimerase|nr:UDP-glucose 4-epimerase GalE [Candidatus Saccharimonadales bacterium]